MSDKTAMIPLSDVQKMASTAAESGLLGISDPKKIYTLMLLCQADGLHPIAAMRKYHVIEGKPAMRADAMLADFMAGGGKVEWHVRTNAEASATFHAPGLVSPLKVTWTMAEAKAQGIVTGKAGLKANWSRHPRQMLAARVVSEGIRAAMPGVVAGIYTPEEVSDFAPPAQPQYTPPTPAPAPAPADVPTIVQMIDKLNAAGHFGSEWVQARLTEAERAAKKVSPERRAQIWREAQAVIAPSSGPSREPGEDDDVEDET